MVIDIHCHLWSQDTLSPTFYNHQAAFFAERWSVGGEGASQEEAVSNLLAGWWDSTGEITLQRMDEAGIQLTVLFPVDFASRVGEAGMSIEEQNRQLAQLQEKNPDRFAFFFNIDPRREGALEMCSKAVKEWGARGLKFHTVVGFYPTDEVVYPLLEVAQEAKIPVLFHSGPLMKPFDEKYAHPSHIEKAAADFPDLTFITAHLSFNWWRDLVECGRKRDNLCCDFSAWQMVAKNNYGQFRHVLRKVVDGFGKERVLFGTDSPAFDPFVSRAEWVQQVKKLAAPSEEGSHFTEDEMEAMLEGNARRVLGL